MKLIFDLDGTLFQTFPCAKVGVRAVCDAIGIPMPEDAVIRDGIGLPSNIFIKNLIPEEVDVDQMLSVYRSAERKDVREHGVLFPGIAETLKQLKSEGHSIVLCSNGSKEYIELVLSSTGISEYFDTILSARDFSSKADAINMYLKEDPTADLLSENGIVIGDTVSDLNAANRNHIPIIAVEYGFGDEDTYRLSDYNAKSAYEILHLIHRIDVY